MWGPTWRRGPTLPYRCANIHPVEAVCLIAQGSPKRPLTTWWQRCCNSAPPGGLRSPWEELSKEISPAHHRHQPTDNSSEIPKRLVWIYIELPCKVPTLLQVYTRVWNQSVPTGSSIHYFVLCVVKCKSTIMNGEVPMHLPWVTKKSSKSWQGHTNVSGYYLVNVCSYCEVINQCG